MVDGRSPTLESGGLWRGTNVLTATTAATSVMLVVGWSKEPKRETLDDVHV